MALISESEMRMVFISDSEMWDGLDLRKWDVGWSGSQEVRFGMVLISESEMWDGLHLGKWDTDDRYLRKWDVGCSWSQVKIVAPSREL